MKDLAMVFVFLPVVAGGILVASVIWISASWAIEGYNQIRSLFHTAN